VEIAARKGTTATDGLIEYAYYLGDSSTPEATWSSAAQNAGTADAAAVQIGRNTASAEARTIWYDSIRAKTLASGWIGPFAAPNIPPVAQLGANIIDIEPWTAQLVNGLSSKDTGTGTVVDYDFRQVSGSPTVTLTGTGGTRTYIAPGTMSGTTLTFGLVVTDDQGSQSVEDTVEHTILPARERVIIGGVETPVKFSSIINGQ